MRRPANAARLACGHPMCDPGSAECRTRDALGTTPEQAEQLRAAALAPYSDRFYRSGADVAADDDGLLRTIPKDLLDQLVDDVQREQRRAVSEWQRTARPGEIGDRVVENWRRSRPGFARLLDLTDKNGG